MPYRPENYHPKLDRRSAEVYPGSDLTEEQWRFGQAMERYKREHRRPFPTCSEVLQVVASLGYVRTAMDAPARAAARILTADDLPERYRKLYLWVAELSEFEGVPCDKASLLSVTWTKALMVEVGRAAGR